MIPSKNLYLSCWEYEGRAVLAKSSSSPFEHQDCFHSSSSNLKRLERLNSPILRLCPISASRIVLIALLICIAVSASTDTGSNNANKHEHANDKHLKAAQEGHKKHNGQELMPDETPENNDQAEKPIPAVTNNNSLTNGKRGRRQRINHQHGKGKRINNGNNGNSGSAHIHTQSDSNANKSARKHARSKSHSTVDSERLSKQHRKQGRGSLFQAHPELKKGCFKIKNVQSSSNRLTALVVIDRYSFAVTITAAIFVGVSVVITNMWTYFNRRSRKRSAVGWIIRRTNDRSTKHRSSEERSKAYDRYEHLVKRIHSLPLEDLLPKILSRSYLVNWEILSLCSTSASSVPHIEIFPSTPLDYVEIVLIALLICIAVSASTDTGSNNANKHEHANDKHLKAAQEGHKKHNGQELMPDETPENNDQAEKPIPAVTNNNSLTNGKRGRRQRINHQHGKGKRINNGNNGNSGSAHIHTQSDSNANKSARKHARSKSHSTVDSERLSKQHRKQGRGKQAK
uniref:Transmembrane protein n=1 Tax=Glossina austeni TaxID=7395 RepID=A0A1A9VNA6_GLOAU